MNTYIIFLNITGTTESLKNLTIQLLDIEGVCNQKAFFDYILDEMLNLFIEEGTILHLKYATNKAPDLTFFQTLSTQFKDIEINLTYKINDNIKSIKIKESVITYN